MRSNSRKIIYFCYIPGVGKVTSLHRSLARLRPCVVAQGAQLYLFHWKAEFLLHLLCVICFYKLRNGWGIISVCNVVSSWLASHVPTTWSCRGKPRSVPLQSITVKRFLASLWKQFPSSTLMIALTCFSHCKLCGHSLALQPVLYIYIIMYRELHLCPYTLLALISPSSGFSTTVFFLSFIHFSCGLLFLFHCPLSSFPIPVGLLQDLTAAFPPSVLFDHRKQWHPIYLPLSWQTKREVLSLQSGCK